MMMLSCLPTIVPCIFKETPVFFKGYESEICSRKLSRVSPGRKKLLGQICCEAIGKTNTVMQLHSHSGKSSSPTLVSNISGDTRHTANFKTSIYDYDYIQSLQSEYLEEAYSKRRDELKGEVKMMLNKAVQDQDQLIMVDLLQRLGVSYHFEEEIRSILEKFHSKNDEDKATMENDLFLTALQFRLLRQNGYNASTDIFNDLRDEISSACMRDDVDGVLALLDASYLLVDGEDILNDAKDVILRYLSEYCENNKETDDIKASLVGHALEFPLHWRAPRWEAHWFISVYQRMHDMNQNLLEFAKLDFNIVQAIHQQEIKEVSRWWKESKVPDKLSFARDRVLENYNIAAGMRMEPIHRTFRVMGTKMGLLGTVIDDIYDVYGTLDELELFTQAVESWRIDSMNMLPDYMKVCFLAVYNCVNETIYYTLKEKGLYALNYLKMPLIGLCKAHLQEAKWCHSGSTPTLQEYMDNSCISIGLPVLLYGSYFTMSNRITEKSLTCLEEFPSVVVNSSAIYRLADDIGSYWREQEHGDSSNLINYYMKESGASLEEALQLLRSLMDKYWKKMNEDLIGSSSLPHIFFDSSLNIARMGLLIYRHGDGFTIQDKWNKDLLSSLYINPISLSTEIFAEKEIENSSHIRLQNQVGENILSKT